MHFCFTKSDIKTPSVIKLSPENLLPVTVKVHRGYKNWETYCKTKIRPHYNPEIKQQPRAAHGDWINRSHNCNNSWLGVQQQPWIQKTLAED